ncbi:MAG: hypothetical protein R6X20_05915 [Phycisphaerae bacterium]
MRTVGPHILIVPAILLAGCGEPESMGPGPWEEAPPNLPADAPVVNCVAPDHWLPYRASFREAEAVVVARCTNVLQYATVRRGHYDFLWYLVTFDAIRTERGMWPHDRVVFCCYDTWPTPESGIMVKKAPFPFDEGRVVALALDPRAVPPRVTGQAWRSRVPPHGKPQPLAFDLQSEEGRRFYQRLDTAIRTFAEQEGWPKATGGSHFEVTDEAYVAEVILRRPDGEPAHRAVAVDKETFAVREVP